MDKKGVVSIWEDWATKECKRELACVRKRQSISTWRQWAHMQKRQRLLTRSADKYLAEPIPLRSKSLLVKTSNQTTSSAHPRAACSQALRNGEKVKVKQVLLRWYNVTVLKKRQKQLNFKLSRSFRNEKLLSLLLRMLLFWRTLPVQNKCLGPSSSRFFLCPFGICCQESTLM